MNGTNYEVPHCGAFSATHSHTSWAQIFALGSWFFSEALCNVSEHAFFYSVSLLASHQTPNLEDHSWSDFHDCLFNIFAVTSISGGLLPHPQPRGRVMPWWHKFIIQVLIWKVQQTPQCELYCLYDTPDTPIARVMKVQITLQLICLSFPTEDKLRTFEICNFKII